MPKLPERILRTRLKNELKMCYEELKHTIEPEDPEFTKFPTRIFVTMSNVPGPVLKEGRITFVRKHKFSIIITDEYPYRKPIVQWLTDIYHPNITTPEKGGHFCSGLLKTEGFNFSLVSFIKSVESLLMNPNPYSPWDTDSCMSAAKYFHDQKKKREKGAKITSTPVPQQRVRAPGPQPGRGQVPAYQQQQRQQQQRGQVQQRPVQTQQRQMPRHAQQPQQSRQQAQYRPQGAQVPNMNPMQMARRDNYPQHYGPGRGQYPNQGQKKKKDNK